MYHFNTQTIFFKIYFIFFLLSLRNPLCILFYFFYFFIFIFHCVFYTYSASQLRLVICLKLSRYGLQIFYWMASLQGKRGRGRLDLGTNMWFYYFAKHYRVSCPGAGMQQGSGRTQWLCIPLVPLTFLFFLVPGRGQFQPDPWSSCPE